MAGCWGLGVCKMWYVLIQCEGLREVWPAVRRRRRRTGERHGIHHMTLPPAGATEPHSAPPLARRRRRTGERHGIHHMTLLAAPPLSAFLAWQRKGATSNGPRGGKLESRNRMQSKMMASCGDTYLYRQTDCPAEAQTHCVQCNITKQLQDSIGHLSSYIIYIPTVKLCSSNDRCSCHQSMYVGVCVCVCSWGCIAPGGVVFAITVSLG